MTRAAPDGSVATSSGLPVRLLVTREGRGPVRNLVGATRGRLGVRLDHFLYTRALGPSRPPSRRRLARAIDGARRIGRWARRRWLLGTSNRWRPSVVVFADIERLSWDERRRATDLWSRLDGSPGVARLLNHPTRSMCRYELLRAMRCAGWNDFDVFRISEGRRPDKYPVFLRSEDDHRGAISGLIETPAALEAAIDRCRSADALSDGTLIVEYCDTRDENGLTRKYGALRVGDRIIPRHVFISRDWMLKSTSDSTGVPREEMARIELEYIATNPHASELMARFELAGIEYGRADYALKDGRIQLWEINTDPTIFLPGHFTDPIRRPVHEEGLRRLRDALLAIGSAAARS